MSVLEPVVAAVLTAEAAKIIKNTPLRRLKPPLQEVAKPKYGIAVKPCFLCSRSDILHGFTFYKKTLYILDIFFYENKKEVGIRALIKRYQVAYGFIRPVRLKL